MEKNGFGQNFILLVKILLKDQELCVINGGKATKCFMLGRGARQGDRISGFLFILALEILFLLTKTKPDIVGLIFDHGYLYSAYADNTTFFLKGYHFYKKCCRYFPIVWASLDVFLLF